MYVKGYLEARALKQQLLAARSKPKKVKAELVTVDMTSDVTDLCEEASPAGEDLEDSDSDEDDDDYDPDASDSEDGSGRGRKKRVRRGNEDDDEGEGDCDGSGDSSGSDYDTDASSDDNSGDSNGESSDAESDAGSAVSRSIGSDAKRGSVPVAAKKTAGVAQPKKAASNKTTAANKTTKPAADAKKGTEVSTKHSSAGPSKVVRKPGEKVERFASAATTATVVAPAVKVESGVVNLTQDEDVVLKPHGAAPVKEGRKSSQPQKKVASVKREPPGAVAATHTAGEGEVIVPEVDSLEGAGSKAAVKSEPIVVVDMSNDVVQVKHEPVVKSASPVAPSVGVKRTIMDMFAMQKKKTASTAGAASSAESTTVKPSEDVGITDLSV